MNQSRHPAIQKSIDEAQGTIPDNFNGQLFQDVFVNEDTLDIIDIERSEIYSRIIDSFFRY